MNLFLKVPTDQDWIRIQLGLRIRIRIWNPDKDPEKAKVTHKKRKKNVKKFLGFKFRMFSLGG
jgi:hypothetical protein